jgi:hypothetical protein
MEDLARTVSIILFFPVVASPLTFLLVWRVRKRWIMVLSLPISIIAAALGLFLLLSEIGTAARALGLWGLLFALGAWKIMWQYARRNVSHDGESR